VLLTVDIKLVNFYPRDAMLARVIAIASCLSVRPSVDISRRSAARGRKTRMGWV